jgi:hypothetical protein
MKTIPETPPDGRTPFERFEGFTRRLMAVPKKEIDEKAKEYERKKAIKTRKKKRR